MRSTFIFALVITFVLTPVVGGSSVNNVGNKGLPKKRATFILNTLTVYNPTTRQCDSSPLITASNARIDPDKLHKQQIRWMALSRDLLKRWKGEFNYGDTVLLSSGDPAIDGSWVIHDNLNKRYKSRGDLLFDSRIRKFGRWENVAISKR